MTIRNRTHISSLLAVLLILAASHGPAAAQDQNHAGLEVDWTYRTVGACKTVAAGDFDGDGDNDLAVDTQKTHAPGASTPPDTSALALWWNDGRGRFDARSAPVITHPFATFVPIDVGGDGILDLAVADSAAGHGIEIVRGLGGGAFSPPALLSNLESAVLAGADMNGDGRQDLLAATSSEPFHVHVFLQAANGTFAPSGLVDTDGQVCALAVGDFDGDGVADLALAEAVNLRVLKGDGAAGFAPYASFPHSLASSGTLLPLATLIAADLDGDGDMDLASAGNGSSARAPAFHRNLGGGAFLTEAIALGEGEDFRGGLGVPDLDLDGDPEILASVGSRDEGTLRLFETVQDATFGLGPRYALEYGDALTVTRMVVAPLDGDAQPDVVLAHFSSSPGRDGRIAVVRTRPAGTLGAFGFHDLGNHGTGGVVPGVRIARFQGSVPELVSFGSLGTYRSPISSEGFPGPRRRISDGREAWILDADRDGRDDLALRFGGDSIGIALTGKDGESQPVSSWLVGQWLAAGDLDGDHRPEIALRRGTDGEVVIAWNDRRGSFRRVTSTGLRTTIRDAFTIDDAVGGDGGELIQFRFDNTWQRPQGVSQDTLRILRALPNGQLRAIVQSLISTSQSLSNGYDTRIRGVVAADVDGDGQNELVTLRVGVGSQQARLQVLRNVGNGFIADAPLDQMFVEDPDFLALADLDGDGDPDATFGSNEQGFIPTLHIVWNDGTGRFAERWARSIPTRGRVSQVIVTDLDGDNVQDVFLGMQRDGSVSYALLFGEQEPGGQPISRVRSLKSGGPGGRLAITAARVTTGANAVFATVTLPSGDGTLDLYDLAGRRVASHRVVAETAGARQIGMPLPGELSKGIYWLVLRQGAERATTRVAILR